MPSLFVHAVERVTDREAGVGQPLSDAEATSIA